MVDPGKNGSESKRSESGRGLRRQALAQGREGVLSLHFFSTCSQWGPLGLWRLTVLGVEDRRSLNSPADWVI